MTWREVTVSEIAAPIPNALATGPFGSAISSRFFTSTGVPVIRGGNLSQEVGVRLNDDGLVFVEPEKATEFSRSIAREGDLVFTCWGTIDQVGLIDERARFREYVISNKQMKLTPNRSVADSLFLYYFFSSEETRAAIRNAGIGSSVPGFNLGQLRGMRIALPPVEEQRAIATVLGALDDKIDLNRRLNDTLEETARALFKSWFVDFDPVRAKANGRQPFGMDAATAALFPDGFEETEFGEVPRGWRIATLGEWTSLVRGTTYKSKLLGADGPYLLGLASIHRNGGFRSDSLRRYAGDSTGKFLLDAGDIYVSLKDVTQSGDLLGSVARVPSWLGGGRLTQDTIRLDVFSPETETRKIFLYWREYCRARAMGTTNLSLSREDFLAFEFPAPPTQNLKALLQIVHLLTTRVEDINESGALIDLRDYLLPKLLSGEVRVREAEKCVGAVA